MTIMCENWNNVLESRDYEKKRGIFMYYCSLIMFINVYDDIVCYTIMLQCYYVVMLLYSLLQIYDVIV